MLDRNANYSTTALPSAQTFGRNSDPTSVINATPSEQWSTNGAEPDMLAYRNWGTDGYSAQHYATTQTDPSPRTNQHDNREQPAWPQQHDEYTPSAEHPVYNSGAFTSSPQTLQTPASQAPPPQPYYPQTPTQQTASPTSSAQTVAVFAPPPPSRAHTYTRTLVGPLSANACRLMDENHKWGIFFLFQDLSVRTEGPHLSQLFLVSIMTA